MSRAPSSEEPEQSDRELSEAETSDSGRSDSAAEEDTSRKLKSGGVNSATTQPHEEKLPVASVPPGASALCPMCDTRQSEYLCTACGRIVFCLNCCVNLHDNKFLAGHSFTSLSTGETVNMQKLKPLVGPKKQPEPAAAIQPPEQPIPRGKTGEAAAIPPSEPDDSQTLDYAALAADRNVLIVRAKDLEGLNRSLLRVKQEIAEERNATKDRMAAATDAVHRKFDILRTVIAAKEQEFVDVVEAAGKVRLETATRHSSGVALAAAELSTFIEHLHKQLERLEGNKRAFDEIRKSMLEDTQAQLAKADDDIHHYEDLLEEVRQVPLGVHIAVDTLVDSIQKLSVPPRIPTKTASSAPLHEKPIPASQFVSAPGVRLFADQPQSQPQSQPSAVPMSLAKEIAELRRTPMKEALSSHASQPQSQLPVAQSRSPMPVRPSADYLPAAPTYTNGNVTIKSNLEVSKAQMLLHKAQQQARHRPSDRVEPIAANRTDSPSRGRGLFPPELDALHRQVVASRKSSPSLRTRSPLRPGGAAVPAAPQQQDVTAYRQQSPRPRQEVPGPGAYYNPKPFNARSVLSTPPRRRI